MKKRTDYEKGFNGETFLTNNEWQTYLKRKPVRFISKKTDPVCSVCGKEGTKKNPLQNAHKISFHIGIVWLALTPDFLDNDNNIVTAHKKKCNKSVELNLEESMDFLKLQGIISIPKFLKSDTKRRWQKIFEATEAVIQTNEMITSLNLVH
jgi:hypothetical protein